SRQYAHRRRRGAHRFGAGADAGHARLYALQDGRRSRQSRRGHPRRPDPIADRRDVPAFGHRQLRRSLRHPDYPSRTCRGRLRPQERLWLYRWQWLLVGPFRAITVWWQEIPQPAGVHRMKTFKALSALLTYPGRDLQEAIPAIRAVLGEELLPSASVAALEPLLVSLETGDIYDLQERYVLLFDRSRTLSLNLFEHIHGESRDRGGAMVD